MAHPTGWAARLPMLAVGLLLVGRATVTYGQSRITGHVVSEADDTPVSAATVAVSADTVNARTTSNGSFAFDRPGAARMLTVHATGFLSVRIPLTPDRADYTIALRKDVFRLETQVVTGLATTVSAASAANAVAVVSNQDVNEVSAPTVETALEGQVPGALFEQNNGGAPGGGVQVQIRGVTSFNATLSPLYVVDGVVVNNETTDPGLGVNRVSDLNPEDIASIEVLKGASSAAIYGSRASSGVIIITTRKGTSGRPQWNLSEKVGQFQDANTLSLRSFPTLSSAQAWFVQDVKHDTGSAILRDNAQIASLYAGPQNYQNALFGSGRVSYESDLNVGGTQGGTQYYASGLVKNDNGTMINTGYTKQSVRANVAQRLNAVLSISLNANYIHDETRRGVTGADNPQLSPYGVLSYTPQFLALDQQRPDGSWPINPFGPANPFADASQVQTPQALSRFIGGGSVSYALWSTERQSLHLSLLGGVDRSNLHDLLLAPATLEEEASQLLPGTAVTNHAVSNYSNYAFNLVHHITASPNLELTTSAGLSTDYRNVTNPIDVTNGLVTTSPPSGLLQILYSYQATQMDQLFYGQEQLITLASRLTVTGGLTAERSTANANINKLYPYPRFAASYRIPTVGDLVDDIKLRAAYGQSGNAVPYPTLDPSGASAPPSALRPEAERETELGFDVTMLRSRAQLSATVYQKHISNALLLGTVGSGKSASTTQFNGGAFTNSGIELAITATPVQLSNSFRWTSGATFYRNYSVVNSLPTLPAPLPEVFGPGTEAVLQPGRSLSQIVAPGAGTANGALQVGDYEPSFVITGSQELTWKRLRLYGLLDWHRGGSVANVTDFLFAGGRDLLADTLGSRAGYAAFTAGSPFPYLQPATFVKLRELSLSYELPQGWMRWAGPVHFSGASLSLEGRNLLAWYGKSYDGLDPEVSASAGLTSVRGVELAPYPPARSIFLNLDLHF